MRNNNPVPSSFQQSKWPNQALNCHMKTVVLIYPRLITVNAPQGEISIRMPALHYGQLLRLSNRFHQEHPVDDPFLLKTVWSTMG